MSKAAKRAGWVAVGVLVVAAQFAALFIWTLDGDASQDRRAADALTYAVAAEREVESRTGELTGSVADLRAVSPKLDKVLKTDEFTMELERGPATGAVVITVNVDLEELQQTVRPSSQQRR